MDIYIPETALCTVRCTGCMSCRLAVVISRSLSAGADRCIVDVQYILRCTVCTVHICRRSDISVWIWIWACRPFFPGLDCQPCGPSHWRRRSVRRQAIPSIAVQEGVDNTVLLAAQDGWRGRATEGQSAAPYHVGLVLSRASLVISLVNSQPAIAYSLWCCGGMGWCCVRGGTAFPPLLTALAGAHLASRTPFCSIGWVREGK